MSVIEASTEAGDQRTIKDSGLEHSKKRNEGNISAHLPNGSKDQRTIANRPTAEEVGPTTNPSRHSWELSNEEMNHSTGQKEIRQQQHTRNPSAPVSRTVLKSTSKYSTKHDGFGLF